MTSQPLRILFPTDFSDCAESAFQHASAFAAKLGAELHVLHVRVLLEHDPYDPAHHFPDRAKLHAILRSQANQRLEELKPEAEVPLITKTTNDVSAGPAIVHYARQAGVELIVMGTQGRTGVPHILLGSVAEHVVDNAPCSVLAVVRGHEKPQKQALPRIILGATDFSEEAGKAIRRSQELARLFDAKLVLAHVIDSVPHPAYYLFGRGSVVDMFPDLTRRCREKLEESVAGEPAVPAGTEIIVGEGRPHTKIVELAREHKAELIVLGAQGMGGLEEVLMGSVTARVMRAAPCPVMAVR